VQITDLANDTHTKQKVRAAVPAPTTTGIGSVRASAKDSAGWHPLAGYNVAGHIDSLRFTLQVAPDSTATMILHAYLVRFTADTTISYPNSPFTSHPRMRWAFTVYPKISLIYRGIDYTDSTVLHADRRRLRGAGPVQIRFQFQAPPRGNYRFEVQTHRQLKARDFAVRSPDFPAVRTPRERAATLAYLMRGPNQKPYLLIKKRLGNINSVSLDKVLKRLLIDKKQDLHDDKNSYAKLIAIKDPDSLRAAVHRFWQVHMDSATARKVAAKYYRRVRQANRLFSNYKEGWKTDRGHLYILYGKPYNVHFVSWWQGTPGKMQLAWPYGNCAGIGGWAYSLMRPREKSAAFPFEHFMLRSGELFNSALPTKKQQQLWLSGNILNTLFWDHEINAPCYE
jgi:GWxTD domain-containing protein